MPRQAQAPGWRESTGFGAALGLLDLAFAVALPLLVIATALRWLVTDREFLLAGFRTNGVGAVTGLSDAQLATIAERFVEYFRAPPGALSVDIAVPGGQRPLLNEREITHMEDVQALVQRVLSFQGIAGALVALRLLVAAAVDRSTVGLGRAMVASAGLTAAVVAVIAGLAFVSFDDLWTRFHQVAFRNDLWQLDPRRDYLIMLFPHPFWLAATVRLVGAVAASMAFIGLLGAAGWLRPGRRPTR